MRVVRIVPALVVVGCGPAETGGPGTVPSSTTPPVARSPVTTSPVTTSPVTTRPVVETTAPPAPWDDGLRAMTDDDTGIAFRVV